MYKANSNVPLTATVEHYDNSGQLVTLYTLVDGKMDGLSQAWHRNGRLMYEDTFVDGTLDGLGRWWHDNGQLSSEHCFRADELTDIAYCKKGK